MIIQTQNGTKLNVPDGSTPADIDDVLQHFQSQGGNISSPASEQTFEQEIAPENVIPKVAGAIFSPLTSLAGKVYNADKDLFTQEFPKTSAVIGDDVDAVSGVLQKGKDYIANKVNSSPAAKAVVNGPVVQALEDTAKVGGAVIPAEGGLEALAGGAVDSGAPFLAGKAGEALQSAHNYFSPPDVTADMVKSEAQKGYQYADQAGGVISPQARNKFINTVNSLHPPSAEVPTDPAYQSVLDIINARKNQPLTLSGAQDLDEHLGDAISAQVMNNGQLTSTGKKLLDVQSSLREYTRNPAQSDIIGGSNGFQAWRQGQALWQKQAQLRDIQQIIVKGMSAQNPASALQSGFARLMINSKLFKQYVPEVQDLIKGAAEGSIGVDALRSLGSRLIPAVAGAVHGPLAGIAGEAASIVGRRGAAAVQLGKANNVAKAIAGKDWQFVEPAVEAPAAQPVLALAAPGKLSPLPMTDDAIARAQAIMRSSSGETGGVNREASDLSGVAQTGNITPQNQRPLLSAPGNASASPMSDDAVARAQAAMRAASGETGGISLGVDASGNIIMRTSPGITNLMDSLGRTRGADLKNMSQMLIDGDVSTNGFVKHSVQNYGITTTQARNLANEIKTYGARNPEIISKTPKDISQMPPNDAAQYLNSQMRKK